MKSVRLFRKTPPDSPACANCGDSRRHWLDRAGLGALLAGLGGMGFVFVKPLAPNVLYEQAQRFKAGLPGEFPEGATFLENQRVYVFREQNSFYAISAVCAHLGCTVKMVELPQPNVVTIHGRQEEERREFQCPCHGSKYHGDGTNYAGPAPKPLNWHRMEIAPDDGQLIVDLSQTVGHDFRLSV